MFKPLSFPLRRAPSLRLSWLAASLLLLQACASPPSQQTLQKVRSQANPTDQAQRTITNFTPALRCMDDLMFRTGTRDVTLMMEEMRDSTQRVQVSTRDMMTSAISEMTRRSRAVRLSVFGSDQQNLQQLLQQAQKNNVFQVVPEFNVRGTISQLDEDVKRDSSSLGLLTPSAFGLRLGSETRFSVLGFDAAVVRTDTFTLVPGVSSKNTTVLTRRDSSAGDGQGRIQGVGTVFAFSAGRSEGTASAARNMVELATIELVGKLIRAPYWQCLGVEDDAAEVQREVQDWFLSMDEGERTTFLKTRMRERGYFDGALDAAATPAYLAALQTYRQALGLAPAPGVDLAFFHRFVNRQVPAGPLLTGARAAGTEAAARPAQVAAVAAALPAATLLLKPVPGGAETQLSLSLANTAGAYVYCYAQDPNTGAMRRIFPNRFTPDPRVEAGRSISLPGRGGFKLSALHQHACMVAPREVYNVLPPQLRWGDFEDIRLADFEAVRQHFAQASGAPVNLVTPRALSAGARGNAAGASPKLAVR